MARNDFQYCCYRQRRKVRCVEKTGHENSKATVTSAAKANGDELKPYMIFPGHKGEVQSLKKDPASKIVATWNQS